MRHLNHLILRICNLAVDVFASDADSLHRNSLAAAALQYAGHFFQWPL